MSDEIVDVDLVADFCNGEPVHEAVPAVKIGMNRYRLLHSPGFAPGAASGDEIELVASETTGYRVVKRSGNLCIQLFLRTCNSAERGRIVNIIGSIGGWLDGGYDAPCGHLLVFTISVDKGFDVIQGAMAQIAAEFPVDKWIYGNVYDTRDGVTPLNWWL